MKQIKKISNIWTPDDIQILNEITSKSWAEISPIFSKLNDRIISELDRPIQKKIDGRLFDGEKTYRKAMEESGVKCPLLLLDEQISLKSPRNSHYQENYNFSDLKEMLKNIDKKLKICNCPTRCPASY